MCSFQIATNLIKWPFCQKGLIQYNFTIQNVWSNSFKSAIVMAFE